MKRRPTTTMRENSMQLVSRREGSGRRDGVPTYAPDVHSRSFRELYDRWPDFPAAGRAALFDTLPQEAQQACWAELRYRADLRIESELIYEARFEEEWPPPKRQPPARSSTTGTRATFRWRVSDDPLKGISGHVYFEAVAGISVPPSGWVSCPMPDHEDVHPSCRVTDTRWRCWSCGAGGSIIDLGEAVYGIEPRGQGFREIRRRLAADLLGRAA
jgi:hypothetical protein